MAGEQKQLLDQIQVVRQAILTGEYGPDRWHPAFDQLNRLVSMVCALVPKDDESFEPGAVPPDDPGAELVPCPAGPSLDDCLEVMRRHCCEVTVKFAGDEEREDS